MLCVSNIDLISIFNCILFLLKTHNFIQNYFFYIYVNNDVLIFISNFFCSYRNCNELLNNTLKKISTELSLASLACYTTLYYNLSILVTIDCYKTLVYS